jgi:hypothetical protein
MLNNSKDILNNDIFNPFSILSFSPNLIIYPTIFIFLSVFYYIYFSNKIKEKINKIKLIKFLYTLLFFLLVIFYNKETLNNLFLFF